MFLAYAEIVRAGFSRISFEPDFWLDGHSRPKKQIVVLSLIQSDAHRQALYHLHIISRGIFRRKQTSARARSARHALDISVIFSAVGVDADVYLLSRVHLFELRLFEVCSDPNIFRLTDDEQLLARLYSLSDFHGFVRHNSADRCKYFRIRQ